jgi:hypothetical protein
MRELTERLLNVVRARSFIHSQHVIIIFCRCHFVVTGDYTLLVFSMQKLTEDYIVMRGANELMRESRDI